MSVLVVKVKSYLNEEVLEYGSGVVLSSDYVLTANHVVCGDRHVIVLDEGEKSAIIEKKNAVAALLRIETELKGDFEYSVFTDQELLNDNTIWQVDGFITDEQFFHQMSGKGLIHMKNQGQDTDYKLKDIEVGYAENYKGLSGSPVICCNRVIGILQVQSYMQRGLLGVDMTSTSRFLDILPAQSITISQYLEEFDKRAKGITDRTIQKNIESKKYIPDIFVEEGDYKENFRYYAQPELFIQKVIEEIENLDLGNINRFLNLGNEQKLDFTDIVDFASNHSVSEICELLTKRLTDVTNRIEKEKNPKREQGLSREKLYLREESGRNEIKHTLERIRDEICFFKYKTIMITKDAGQGKTNFLCDFARNFLMRKKMPVLFYNAYDFREPFMNVIKKDLTINDTYSWKYVQQVLTHRWQIENKVVVIIIDGLNENTALNDFGGYVVDFLNEALKLPFIKVVLSTRNELLKERFAKLNSEEFGSEFCQLDMRYQSDKFMERIFWGYLKHFDVNIMENSLLVDTYDMLARDTLLLRFFCEVNQGKRQVCMRHVYKYSLFQKYYEMKKKDVVRDNSFSQDAIFDKLINHICQIMIESRNFNNINRNNFSVEELTIFDKLLESDVIFKQDRQKTAGLIDEIEIVINFTFDEFRDFCITRYILNNDDEKSFEELWKRMHLDKWSILEGVERYIFFLVRKKGNKYLSILQREDGYEQLYWRNVWDLEEKDITMEDIQLWKNEFLTEGTYVTSVAYFLLERMDRSYFRKINIDLLFEFLNQMADNLETFNYVIQKLFGKKRKDAYGRYNREVATVMSCDDLIKAFKEHSEDIEYLGINKDFLRLTIYMLEIDIDQIRTMWIDIYTTLPEAVEGILRIYIMKEDLPLLIYKNVESILDFIIKGAGSNMRLDELKEMLNDKVPKYNYDLINEKIASIWNR